MQITNSRYLSLENISRLFKMYSDWKWADWKNVDRYEATTLYRYLRRCNELANIAERGMLCVDFTAIQSGIIMLMFESYGFKMTDAQKAVYKAVDDAGGCERSDIVDLILEKDDSGNWLYSDDEVDKAVDQLIEVGWFSIDCDQDLGSITSVSVSTEFLGNPERWAACA